MVHLTRTYRQEATQICFNNFILCVPSRRTYSRVSYQTHQSIDQSVKQLSCSIRVVFKTSYFLSH